MQNISKETSNFVQLAMRAVGVEYRLHKDFKLFGKLLMPYSKPYVYFNLDAFDIYFSDNTYDFEVQKSTYHLSRKVDGLHFYIYSENFDTYAELKSEKYINRFAKIILYQRELLALIKEMNLLTKTATNNSFFIANTVSGISICKTLNESLSLTRYIKYAQEFGLENTVSCPFFDYENTTADDIKSFFKKYTMKPKEYKI